MDLSEKQLQALQESLEITERDSGKDGWLGFSWYEVHSSPASLNALVGYGLLDIAFQSNRYTYYQIANLDKVRKLLDAVNQGESILEDDESPLIVPHDLFDIIVNQESTKNILKMAIQAGDPVHCLLVGRPATAKSLFLSELARIPGSRLALGGTSSRAGIVDFLIDARPRFLIIDEIDKADGRDMDVILSLMENGLVTRLKKNMREQVKLRTWVFAGANSERFVSQPLLSRFVVRRMADYTQKDFEEISHAILVKRERVDPMWADKIVAAITSKTTDPRDSVKVARLLQDISQLDEIVNTIWS